MGPISMRSRAPSHSAGTCTSLAPTLPRADSRSRMWIVCSTEIGPVIVMPGFASRTPGDGRYGLKPALRSASSTFCTLCSRPLVVTCMCSGNFVRSSRTTSTRFKTNRYQSSWASALVPGNASTATHTAAVAAAAIQVQERRGFANIYIGALVICCSQDITSAAPAARANYNALQANVEQRLAHGVQLTAHYTWSRAMNYGSTYFAQNPRVEYGPTDTNRNNVFVLSGLWQLPVGRVNMINTQGKVLNAAIGGWQLSGTTTWESGLD